MSADIFKQPLDLVFSQNGVCSKRAIKNFLISNSVYINEKKIDFNKNLRTHKMLVDVKNDKIVINNVQQNFFEHFYFMMNKPKNVVCSTVSDSHKTVFNLIEENIKNKTFLFDNFFSNEEKENFYKHIQLKKIKCVGRLDCDTTGLLLFATNGSFVNFITDEKNKIKKTYFVTLKNSVDKKMQNEYSKKIQNGFYLPPEKKSSGFKTRPSKIVWLTDTTLELTITEGRFHQIRRMFLELGNFVQELKRIKIENLALDNSIKQEQIKVLSRISFDFFLQ